VHVDLVRLDKVRLDAKQRFGLARFGADAHQLHLVEGGDHLLGQEQPERELEIVARRPHHDAERFAVQRQLERLLGRNAVVDRGPTARGPAPDGHRRRGGPAHGRHVRYCD
jgi:hypothetical protein